MQLRLLLCLAMFAGAPARATETVRLQGSNTVAEAFKEAAPALKERFDIELKGDSKGGSTVGIYTVASGLAEIAMASRAITPQDRSRFPEKFLHERLIGYQALIVAVPLDVWESGVHALSQKQLLSIYEKKATNWKDFGGADREIRFFNPPRSDGTWEFFTQWLYGDVRHAPLGKSFERVNPGRDTRDAVEFFSGAISVTTRRWVDGKRVFALGLAGEDGEIIEPTEENIRSGVYPIARPLYLITGDRPVGILKKIIDFMSSTEGQEFVKKAEFIGIADPVPYEEKLIP